MVPSIFLLWRIDIRVHTYEPLMGKSRDLHCIPSTKKSCLYPDGLTLKVLKDRAHPMNERYGITV